MRYGSLLLVPLAMGCAAKAHEAPADANRDDAAGRSVAELVAEAVDASTEELRAEALEAALVRLEQERPDPESCASFDRLGRAARRWPELNARRALRVIDGLPCAGLEAAVEGAARGRWAARTGVTRALALRVLATGASGGLYGAEEVARVLDAAAVDRESDLVRAAALALGALPRDRAALVEDPSPLVRAAVEGDRAASGGGGGRRCALTVSSPSLSSWPARPAAGPPRTSRARPPHPARSWTSNG